MAQIANSGWPWVFSLDVWRAAISSFLRILLHATHVFPHFKNGPLGPVDMMAGKSSPLCCNSFPLRPIRLRGKVPTWRYLHHWLLGVKVRKGLRERFALLTLPTRSLLTPALSQFPYIHHYKLRIADTFEPETHGRTLSNTSLQGNQCSVSSLKNEKLAKRGELGCSSCRINNGCTLSDAMWLLRTYTFFKILPQRQSCSWCKKVFKVQRDARKTLTIVCSQIASWGWTGCNPSFVNSNKMNMCEMEGLTLRLIAIDDQLGRLQAF